MQNTLTIFNPNLLYIHMLLAILSILLLLHRIVLLCSTPFPLLPVSAVLIARSAKGMDFDDDWGHEATVVSRGQCSRPVRQWRRLELKTVRASLCTLGFRCKLILCTLRMVANVCLPRPVPGHLR